MTENTPNHMIKLHPDVNKITETGLGVISWTDWHAAAKVSNEKIMNEWLPTLVERIRQEPAKYNSEYIMAGDTLLLVERMDDKLHIMIAKMSSYGSADVPPNGSKPQLKVLEGGKIKPLPAA